jgi:hypothetical protein
MSPQAVAGMTSDMAAGKRASNQSGLRECIAAAFNLSDMREVMITTPSPVKRIPIKKV